MNIHAYMESIGLTAAQIEAVSKLASVSQSEYLMEGLADFGDEVEELGDDDPSADGDAVDIVNSDVYPTLVRMSKLTETDEDGVQVPLPSVTAGFGTYADFVKKCIRYMARQCSDMDKIGEMVDCVNLVADKFPNLLTSEVVSNLAHLEQALRHDTRTLPSSNDTSRIPDVVDTIMQDTVDGVGRGGMTGRYNQMQTGNVDDIGVDEEYQEEFGDTIANMDDTSTNEDDEFSDDDERTEKYTLTTIQELYPVLQVFIGATNAQRYPDDTKNELRRKTDNELASIYAGLAKFNDTVENTGMGSPKMPHKVFAGFIEHPNAVLLDKATERINRALRNCIASYQGPMGSIKRTLTNKQKDLLDSNDVPYDIRESLGFSAKSLSDGDIVDGADTYDQFMSAEENKPTEKTVSGDNADFWKALGQEGREVITSHDRAKRLAKEALARRRNAAAMKQGQQLTESIEDDDDVGTIYDDYMNDLEKRNAGRDPLDFEQNVEREYLPEDWKENDEPHANELPDRDLDPKSVQATNLVSDHFDTHARSMDREDVNNMDAFAAYCGQPGVRTDAYRDRTKQIAKRSLARVLAANKAKALHEATDELQDITTAEPANSYFTNRVKKSLARAANAQKTRRYNQDLDKVMGKHGEGDFGNYREMLKKSYLAERQH